jgi:hypothetical protein
MAKKPVLKLTNRVFAKKNPLFLEACKSAGIEPTMRQASKYRRKQGLAFGKKS